MANYPIAAGQPDWVAAGLVKEVWSNDMTRTYYADTVIPQITNIKGQGEIKGGGADTVHFPVMPVIDITLNMGDAESINYQELSPSVVDLVINKSATWAYKTGNILAYQSYIKWMAATVPHATREASIAIERLDFFKNIYSSAHADNIGTTAGAISGTFNMGVSGTPRQLTASNAIQIITDAGSVLDEQNVGQEEGQRYIVIPTWVANKIKNSEIREVYKTGDSKSPMRTGLIGMIDRFHVYQSNNIEMVADSSGVNAYNIIFGHKEAVCFATQFTDTRLNFELEGSFQHASRGRQWYGYKAINPKGLGHLYVKA